MKIEMKSLIMITIALCLIPDLLWATDIQDNNDPRFLSSLILPMSRDCSSDVSNDGLLFYTVCDGKPGIDGMSPTEQAQLYIYDISDLHNPRKISQTDIGKVEGMRLVVRNGIAYYQKIGDSNIQIVDVRDPQHPVAAGNIDTNHSMYFRVSEDGHLLVTKQDASDYKFYDTSNLAMPKESAVDATSELINEPGQWNSYESGKIEGIEGELAFKDMRDKKALVAKNYTDDNMLQLYDLSVKGNPKLLASFPENGTAYSVHLIPDTQAVVFGESGGPGFYKVEFSLATNPAFNATNLKKIYAASVEKYSLCRGEHAPECVGFFFSLIPKLQDAGIERLMDETIEGFSQSQRVVMLNNYGFWLYQRNRNDKGNLEKSASILRKVTELAPESSVAWLNLGDTNHLLIPLAITDAQKAALWNETKKDYAHYDELSGKKAPEEKDFLSFNLPEILKSSRNVCDYVAQAYNHDGRKEISSPEGSVSADGKTVKFVAGYTGGSCGWPAIKAEGCKGENDCFDNDDLLKPFLFASEDWGYSDVSIVPFRAKYYTVSSKQGELDQLVDPVSGPLCNFKREYHAELVENKSPTICENYLHDKLKHNVKWIEADQPEFQRALEGREMGAFGYNNDRMAVVDLSGNGKKSYISHYNLE